MYDAIVVGARCAGAATAMLPARRGLDVLLVGPERLHDWGLLERVLATGCPAIEAIVDDFGDFSLRGTGLVVDGVPVGLGPRRAARDAVLVEAAVEAGAELRESFPVTELIFDDGRVTGIRAATARPSGRAS